MEQLKSMKESLTSMVQGQMANIAHADPQELGMAVDMIKDLAEAIYYCSITDAMEESEKEKKYQQKQPQMMYSQPVYYNRPMNADMNYSDYSNGKMYYSSNTAYEGRSPMRRRMYMESKAMNHDKSARMKELEDYMSELSNDIMEMIENTTPEEKQILRQKISTLANKIQ